jgi:hypothetical protein
VRAERNVVSWFARVPVSTTALVGDTQTLKSERTGLLLVERELLPVLLLQLLKVLESLLLLGGRKVLPRDLNLRVRSGQRARRAERE